MNKEDILNAARKNNAGREYEGKAEIKGNLLSALTALVVGAFLFFFEYLRNRTFNWGIAAIVLVACATQALYEGIKLRRVLWIVVGSLQAILAAVTLIVAIIRLVG